MPITNPNAHGGSVIVALAGCRLRTLHRWRIGGGEGGGAVDVGGTAITDVAGALDFGTGQGAVAVCVEAMVNAGAASSAIVAWVFYRGIDQ